jgi:hypothetical protein
MDEASTVSTVDWLSHCLFERMSLNADEGMLKILFPLAVMSAGQTTNLHVHCRICRQRAPSMDGATRIQIEAPLSADQCRLKLGLMIKG